MTDPCFICDPQEYSFAHATMSVRLPTILEKGIADVHLTVNQEVRFRDS